LYKSCLLSHLRHLQTARGKDRQFAANASESVSLVEHIWFSRIYGTYFGPTKKSDGGDGYEIFRWSVRRQRYIGIYETSVRWFIFLSSKDVP
jgi:hypothetical protein